MERLFRRKPWSQNVVIRRVFGGCLAALHLVDLCRALDPIGLCEGYLLSSSPLLQSVSRSSNRVPNTKH